MPDAEASLSLSPPFILLYNLSRRIISMEQPWDPIEKRLLLVSLSLSLAKLTRSHKIVSHSSESYLFLLLSSKIRPRERKDVYRKQEAKRGRERRISHCGARPLGGREQKISVEDDGRSE